MNNTKERLLKNMRCRCGEPSVEFDSWFNWCPCEKHKHIPPSRYHEVKLKGKNNE